MQLNKLISSHSRMEELQQAIEWSLRRSPRTVTPHEITDNTFLWVTAQLSIDSIPAVKIIYSVDDESKKITLISIDRQVDSSLN